MVQDELRSPIYVDWTKLAQVVVMMPDGLKRPFHEVPELVPEDCLTKESLWTEESILLRLLN